MPLKPHDKVKYYTHLKILKKPRALQNEGVDIDLIIQDAVALELESIVVEKRHHLKFAT